MDNVTVIFKSGAKVEFQCNEIEIGRDRYTGELTSYSLKGIGKKTPMYVRIQDIDCILTESIKDE